VIQSRRPTEFPIYINELRDSNLDSPVNVRGETVSLSRFYRPAWAVMAVPNL
jgi:hypothetical protein